MGQTTNFSGGLAWFYSFYFWEMARVRAGGLCVDQPAVAACWPGS